MLPLTLALPLSVAPAAALAGALAWMARLGRV
jgi:hypothetical protein